MNQTPDDFRELRSLLSWKRQERPPPGFFSGFSSQVVARIEAERFYSQNSWWSRWLLQFDTKPILICAYGLVVCSGFLFGLSSLSMNERASASLPIANSNNWLIATPVTVPVSPPGEESFRRFASPETSTFSPSTPPAF